MLRWALPLLVTVAACGNASAADLAPGYDYRATVIRGTPPPLPAYVAPQHDALISSFVWTTPLLPGSYTLPGYYGRPFDYYYQGAYYGGQYSEGYNTYFIREPYACGVTGYC
jgi:hypothetical protein